MIEYDSVSSIGVSEGHTYKYIPENSDEYGIISLDRMTGEKKIDKLVLGYSMNYPAHAFHRIKEYLVNNNFQKKDIIAWY